MKVAKIRETKTGGRGATARHIPPELALAVGMPKSPPPKGWRWSELTALARLESGHTPSRRHPEYWGGDIPWLSIQDAKAHSGGRIDDTSEHTNEVGIANSSARVLPTETVCLSRTASVGYVVVMGQPMATSQDFVNWVCSSELDPRFLQHLILAEGDGLLRFASGAVHSTIYFPEVKAFHICHPPLAEQRRIVGILDEAFAGIAVAKRNAEQNLQNARTLFESHLQAIFTQRGDGWEETVFSDVCDISSSLVDPRKQEYQDMPHVGGANIVSKTGGLVDLKTARDEGLISGKFIFDESAVLYSKIRPYLMKVARPDFSGLCSADIYPLSPKQGLLDRDYLFHLLLSPLFTDYAVKGSARAGMPKVNREYLFSFPFYLPPVDIQRIFASQLDSLLHETQRLTSLYQQKLIALDELTKSLLARAFAGELTAAPAKSTVTAPKSKAVMGSTDLHVGIVAMAYRVHERANKCDLFGHVKAEKIAHMIESHLGVDLGRQPVKDAAGPNDYPHLRKIEHRASKTAVFDVKSQGDRYAFTPLDRMDDHIAKTSAALGERLPAVEEMLTLMLPLKTQQAEILATVYAAWNNLLIDDAPITDEAIVLEARENWHPNKLNIPREKFFKAIGWIREKEIVPTGTGSRVNPRS